MKRRELLLRALQAGALLTLPKPLKIFANQNVVLTSGGGNPLRIPPVFTNGGTMTLDEATVQVWPGQNTQLFAINGTFPSPTVRIQKGQTFTANFVNNLSEPTTAHWHGVATPAAMDGHPRDPINRAAHSLTHFP